MKTDFGVPQSSILGPLIFNIYVSDLQKNIRCPCYKYADDTTILLHSRVQDLNNCATKMNEVITRLGNYSSDSNVALNPAKIVDDAFDKANVSNTCSSRAPSGSILLRNTVVKSYNEELLGVHFDEHLTWREHVTAFLSSCNAVLSVLRKLRNLAP